MSDPVRDSETSAALEWTRGAFEGYGGIELFYRYHAARDAQDTMVILHGHGEHSGRYEKFAGILQGCGISLASYDARGNGRSGGRDVYVESFEEYLEDLTCFRRFLRERYLLSGPVILLGHSLGGLAALHWAARFPHELKGLILSSPCLGLRLPPIALGLNAFLGKIAPALLYRNPVYPPHLTHNQAEVELYKKDDLIKRKISVRLLSEMLTYMARLDPIERFDFPFPVYILMAGLERVVDSEKTRAVYAKIQAPDKRLDVFDGFYHEIFNELGQEKAFEVLKENLEACRKQRI